MVTSYALHWLKMYLEARPRNPPVQLCISNHIERQWYDARLVAKVANPPAGILMVNPWRTTSWIHDMHVLSVHTLVVILWHSNTLFMDNHHKRMTIRASLPTQPSLPRPRNLLYAETCICISFAEQSPINMLLKDRLTSSWIFQVSPSFNSYLRHAANKPTLYH